MTQNETELNPPPTPATPGRSVSRDEVRHVAALASLELTAHEEERMERDLNAILGYVAELNELDTADVVPMSQVSEILAGIAGPGRPLPAIGTPADQPLRADQPRPSLPRSAVMAGAPSADGTFFKVPRVIER
jgi:aspartyl-tRNA(Asn)/glutamyl-tRNA(Gln) amidotransferase subunit C